MNEKPRPDDAESLARKMLENAEKRSHGAGTNFTRPACALPRDEIAAWLEKRSPWLGDGKEKRHV
jgi:hypothetical protein